MVWNSTDRDRNGEHRKWQSSECRPRPFPFSLLALHRPPPQEIRRHEGDCQGDKEQASRSILIANHPGKRLFKVSPNNDRRKIPGKP
jgi:hypothetical protein